MKSANILNRKNRLMLTAFFSGIALSLTACDRSSPTPDPDGGGDPAILLTCKYFDENPNARLVDNPDASIDYIVPQGCIMKIKDDVIIEPGVTIMFKSDAGFEVLADGSLYMVGTSSNKITLTGEDKVPGSWMGVCFRSNDPKNEMAHTVVEYGGGKPWTTSNESGNVFISFGTLKFHDNLVQYGKHEGLHIARLNATVSNISNNVFKENKTPILTHMATIEEVAANNTYDNNEINMVRVNNENISKNTTIKKLSVPYLFQPKSGHKKYDFLYNLTIQPGAEIVMGAGVECEVRTGTSFVAAGTAAEAVILRGFEATKGYWKGITVNSSLSTNNIAYARIAHAGGSTMPGAIRLGHGGSQLSVSNTHFQDISACAIHHSSSHILNVGPGNTYVNCDGEICLD